ARSALESARERELAWLEHECHHVLGTVAREGGDLEAALGEYEAAVASVERVQRRLATELRANFLEDKLQIYHDAIACAVGVGDHELAFDYLERAKSRALVDYLTSSSEVRLRVHGEASRDLVDELARLREEHAW